MWKGYFPVSFLSLPLFSSHQGHHVSSFFFSSSLWSGVCCLGQAPCFYYVQLWKCREIPSTPVEKWTVSTSKREPQTFLLSLIKHGTLGWPQSRRFSTRLFWAFVIFSPSPPVPFCASWFCVNFRAADMSLRVDLYIWVKSKNVEIISFSGLRDRWRIKTLYLIAKHTEALSDAPVIWTVCAKSACSALTRNRRTGSV